MVPDATVGNFGLIGPGAPMPRPALPVRQTSVGVAQALMNHVSFLTGPGGAAVIRSAKLEDLIPLGRFLARDACPDRHLTNRCRALRQSAIMRAVQALKREDRLYLVVESGGTVCAALSLRISGGRVVAGRPMVSRVALTLDPRIDLRLIEHVAECYRLGGWLHLNYLMDCATELAAQAIVATLQKQGFPAEARRARKSLMDRLRFRTPSHEIRVSLLK